MSCSFRIVRTLPLLIILSGSLFNLIAQTNPCEDRNPDKSVEEYSERIRLNPKDYVAYVLRGWVYFFQKHKNPEAFADMDKAIELRSDSVYPFNNRGRLYSQLGKYKESIEDFSSAIAIDGNNEIAWYQRGRSNQWNNNRKAATSDFENLLEIQPEHPSGLYGLGLEHYFIGDKTGALVIWNRAVDILNSQIGNANPLNCNSNLFLTRGMILSSAERYNDSIADLNKAADLRPKYYETYFYRADLYKSIRAYDRSIADYSKSIELNPFFAESYRGRSIIFRLINDLKSATEDENKYKELTGRDIGSEKQNSNPQKR
jgi:tetratricopeptide (TPR) repeat protein